MIAGCGFDRPRMDRTANQPELATQVNAPRLRETFRLSPPRTGLPVLDVLQKMKLIAFLLTFLLGGISMHGQGWNDYQLDIGDGYMVFRSNSMDVGIGREDGRSILHPGDHERVGPVVAYQVLEGYILTKNAGSSPRDLFEGDTYENVDHETKWFFVIPKDTESPLGPFNEIQFQATVERLELVPGEWLRPRNPEIIAPLLGSLLFLAMALPIIAIKYFYISIPVFCLLIWAAVRFWNKRRQNQAVDST